MLAAWQFGMHGVMGFAYFHLFRTVLGIELRMDMAEFRFMHENAMEMAADRTQRELPNQHRTAFFADTLAGVALLNQVAKKLDI